MQRGRWGKKKGEEKGRGKGQGGRGKGKERREDDLAPHRFSGPSCYRVLLLSVTAVHPFCLPLGALKFIHYGCVKCSILKGRMV